MKKIYTFNKFALIITLVLYTTVILGLYAQIVLGALQIICALILFFHWKKISQKSKEHLIIYWTTVLLYGLCWLIDWSDFNEEFILIFGIMLLPMSMAGYFLYILNTIKKYVS